MKFSYNWLRQWVELDVDAHELARRLTAAGLEVDSVKATGGGFDGVVVARIVDCQPHPNADKLVVCRVDAGSGEDLQVVCGAPNARAGLIAPLAKVGATLGDDMTVRRVELRGVASDGMLCSGRELGLGDDHSGLLELPSDSTVGEDLASRLDLDDFTIDLDLTPNRADCLSIRGIARDVAAICRSSFIEQDQAAVPAEINDRFAIELKDPEDCPRYAGRVIRGIDPAARTPLWMSEALRRCGLRSISPVVDVTNYVLLELGQPMHAFDLERLDSKIVVRRAKKGESLQLLDGQEVELDESVLAICDAEKPVALGGIMGGMASAVSDDTTDILFESAWFKPGTIMGKARDFGLHTDASHRFERGVDPDGQVRAVERATQLLLEIAGGKPGPVLCEEQVDYLPGNRPVRLRISRLNHLLGTDISRDEAAGILQSLGMEVKNEGGEALSVAAPNARFDIAIEEDLIEEVARVHGYDQIPEAIPSGSLSAGSAADHEVPLPRIQATLCAAGFQEVINYSFLDPALLNLFGMDKGTLPLANALSSDLSVMRTSLVPGLVSTLLRNTRRQHARVRLFETGVTFVQSDSLQESQCIAGVVCGRAGPENWADEDRNRASDFFDIKGVVESLLSLGGRLQHCEFRPATMPWAHPGASAVIYEVSSDGEVDVGWCAEIHPSVLKALDFDRPVFAFELDLRKVQKREVPYAKTYSRFPSVRRDLALEVPVEVTYEDLRQCVRECAGALLQNLVIFDVYEGQNLKKGYKSLAIGLILQHVSSTLTDEAIEELLRGIVSELKQRLGARLRG